MGQLEPEARSRVVRWAIDRYEVSGIKLPGSRSTDGGADAGEREASLPAAYQEFADLFDAARPKQNDEKALVAGYWLQVVQGQPGFKSADAQAELKNLGHAIANITDALTTNMKKKPALVLQTGKAGTARSARKSYKLTNAGTRAVERMLTGDDGG